MEKKISAVIFDLDGLLLDSEVYWERARHQYAASRGCDWTHEDELQAKGMNSAEWAGLIRQRCGLEATRDEIIKAVTELMRELYRQHLPLLPGTKTAVQQVAARYPVGLASSSPLSLIEYVLHRARLRECFTAVVSADTVGKGKPAPDVFLEAARRLATPPAAVAVFEDSSAGVEAGRRAGMKVVLVPNPHFPPSPEALAKASLVLHSLAEFKPNMLEEL